MFSIAIPIRSVARRAVAAGETSQRAWATSLVGSLFWIALYVGAVRLVSSGGVATGEFGLPIPAIDLPAGVALAVILCLGYRAWPILLVAIALSQATTPLAVSSRILLALALLGQALAGRHLIERSFAQVTSDFAHSFFYLLSVVRGALVSAVVGATAQAGIWCLEGHAVPATFIWLWLSLWLSGALGMLFVAVLTDGRGEEMCDEGPSRSRTVEAVLLGVCLVGASASLLGIHPFRSDGFPFYLFLPIMVWSAFHFGVRGAAFAVLAILAPAACGTAGGVSLLGMGSYGILKLQSVVVVVGGTTLALASAVDSFRRLESDQRRAQRRLRQQVDRQSHELKSSNLSLLGQISERQRVEEELRESQARYQELFENANDIVYTHDLSGRFLSINKAGERVSGFARDELLGTTIDRLLAPEHLERARQMIQRKVESNVSTVYELEILRKDGGRVPLEVSTRMILQEGHPVAVQGIARDITERKRAEHERRELDTKIQYAQRLESMTNLAEGIAHDFNNLLTRIVANVGVAALDLPEGSPVTSSLKRIELAAEHAAELVEQMFAYAGKGRRRMEALHLAGVVESMSSLLESVVPKGTTLIYDLGAERELVAADTTQVRQIVMNLVMNASDALPEEGGTIEVRTGLLNLAEGDSCGWPGKDGVAGGPLAPGRYVWIEIADNGAGIHPESRARIFDPFFTTKSAGRGLGLAAVLGIVRAHRGGIRISSEVGQGTSFQVMLPVLARISHHPRGIRR